MPTPGRQMTVEIEKFLSRDIADNRAIGGHGAAAILAGVDETRKVTVLTHCNTGALATAGYGTALGVVRALHEAGRLEHVYCTETRPYNQGSRLTAYELVYEGIPGTLICDSMAAALMADRRIDAVVLGADRVVANGDCCNKIGTYQLSVVAAHHGVPFYVAAPRTTIDMTLSSGKDITIEERPADELCCINGAAAPRAPPPPRAPADARPPPRPADRGRGHRHLEPPVRHGARRPRHRHHHRSGRGAQGRGGGGPDRPGRLPGAPRCGGPLQLLAARRLPRHRARAQAPCTPSPRSSSLRW